jgi:phage-related baseplate assembly protein
MSRFDPIDLSQLAPPDVVEVLDYEALLAERKTYAISLWPDAEQAAIAALLELETEPLNILLQENTYREVILRQRINDACKAVMLPYSTNADLEVLAAFFGVTRLLVTPEDTSVNPPIPAVWENDERLRMRTQMALEGYSTAGAVGGYTFHTLSASALVKDVDISSPTPGTVQVVVLSTEGDGTPDAPLLTTVTNALNDEEVRPLCDTVSVIAATIVDYTITATLKFFEGPGSAEVLAAAQAAAEAYAVTQHNLGRDITRSGIFAALHQPGVQNVTLTAPAADIVVDHHEAARCTAITLTDGGIDE